MVIGRYWPTRWRQRVSSDVVSDVTRKEDGVRGAVRASDDASDDHVGCLRLSGAGSKHTPTEIFTLPPGKR